MKCKEGAKKPYPAFPPGNAAQACRPPFGACARNSGKTWRLPLVAGRGAAELTAPFNML